jgi:hypothetical protein
LNIDLRSIIRLQMIEMVSSHGLEDIIMPHREPLTQHVCELAGTLVLSIQLKLSKIIPN